MNELTVFKNEQFGEVRTQVINDEVWFVGKDVCEVFGDTNYRRSLLNIDDEDKSLMQINTSGGNQNMIFINESGLYSLLFQMQPQKAKGVSQNDNLINERIEKLKAFRKWVTSEVLPSIRKHGVYAVDEVLANPDMLINALQALKEERAKNTQLVEDNNRMKPKEIFADAVSVSDTSILVGELAKLIMQNGKPIGQNKLFAWLRDKSYLIKGGSAKNMPTQKSMDLGLFEICEKTINNPDGSVRITKTPKVTGKGQIYFINKFLGKNEVTA